jgi:uracil-DNA glycosylase
MQQPFYRAALALVNSRGCGLFRQRRAAPSSPLPQRRAKRYFTRRNPGQEMSKPFDRLLAEIRACTLCAPYLPLGPRPLFLGRPSARLLVISQAPGVRAHETSLSFNDRSGDRLRAWLGIGREEFYDESRVAILPMGFCYPGRDQKGGDLPPRPECAPLWHPPVRALLPSAALTLLVGGYAVRYYRPQEKARPLSETLARWREYPLDLFLLPHPSWRTTQWLAQNPWFEREALPELRGRVRQALNRRPRSAPSPRR